MTQPKPKPTKADIEARVAVLKGNVAKLKDNTAPYAPVTGATLDPLTVLLEDLFDLLLEIIDAIPL